MTEQRAITATLAAVMATCVTSSLVPAVEAWLDWAITTALLVGGGGAAVWCAGRAVWWYLALAHEVRLSHANRAPVPAAEVSAR